MATATSNRPSLAAEPRDISGKRVASLRREGKLPAVLFGNGLESVSVSVDAHDFDLLRRKVGPNALVDLSVGGKKAQPVLVHRVLPNFHAEADGLNARQLVERLLETIRPA